MATLISTGLDCLMPVYALITQGTKAEKNTINALACRPIPIQMMVSGIQETGGMGRRISKMGRINLSNPRNQPIKSPRGIPMTIASRKPVRATWRLAMM